MQSTGNSHVVLSGLLIVFKMALFKQYPSMSHSVKLNAFFKKKKLLSIQKQEF